MTVDPRLNARMVAAAVVTGVAAGFGGIVLTLLLHLIQHLAFGYTEESFLIGVEKASGARRVLAMTVGGAVVGLGWYALRRWTRPPASVADALQHEHVALRFRSAGADAVLQIIAVGFGASFGREGAPRQVGAALGAAIGRRLGLGSDQRRTLLACGAGSGLAAVYNVPLGGALFTLEILLVSAALHQVVPALLSAAIATAVCWPVLSTRPSYQFTPVPFHPTLLVFALVFGPIAGLAGRGFTTLMTTARSFAPTGWRLPIVVTGVFAAVGLLAVGYPQLLGNGKGPAQLAFDGTLSVAVLVALILLKPLVTAACVGSGAVGGLLTPALATGALLGELAGGAWTALWPGTSLTAFALVGAAAMLATTQRAPLCAIVLVLELTDSGLHLLVPIVIAVAGAMVTAQLLGRPAAGTTPPT